MAEKRSGRRQATASMGIVRRDGTVEPLTLRAINASDQQRKRQAEYGASGTHSFQGTLLQTDYNRLFDGRNGLPIFDQMERSDAQVGAAIDIIRLPIRAARFRAVAPEKPSGDETAIADAVQFALFEQGAMLESWDMVLRHLLMRVWMGFGFVEKVWFFDEDRNMLRFLRLAPRLPVTVHRWITEPNGLLREIEQYVSIEGRFAYKRIPADYAVLTVREREGDNYFGRSILRRIHKHWYYKDELYRIDAVKHDRYGVGIPDASIDPTHPIEEDELDEIERMLQGMRSNEQAYLIHPSTISFSILTPSGGQGGTSDLMESVKHHDSMIVRGVLATFLTDHSEGLNTNRTRTLADIFLHALNAEVNSIVGDVHAQAVRPLCDMNFDMSKNRYPLIEVTGIDDLAIEALAAHLPALATAGYIQPDDSIEDVLRKLLKMPPLALGWRRGEEKPAPPKITTDADAGADEDEDVTADTE